MKEHEKRCKVTTYHGRYFSFEIQNVRAERRESRDLMQDLEDIRNGIQIVEDSRIGTCNLIFLSNIFHLTTYTILVVKFHRQ